MTDLKLMDVVILALVFYGLWAIYSALLRVFKKIKAKQDIKRYQAERDAIHKASETANRNSRDYTAQYILEEDFKDKDARVEGIAEPKGFWSKLIMGEKMGIIREMIRIANSAEHKGYWQDRVQAQKNVEAGRSFGDDRQGR